MLKLWLPAEHPAAEHPTLPSGITYRIRAFDKARYQAVPLHGFEICINRVYMQ